MKTKILPNTLNQLTNETALETESKQVLQLPDDSKYYADVRKTRNQLRQLQRALEKIFNQYVYGESNTLKKRCQGYIYPKKTPEELNHLINYIRTLRDRIVQMRDRLSYLTGEGL